MEQPGEVVRAARSAAGLSIRALAKLGRVSVSTVTRIEAGQTDPNLGTLRRLLGAAGYELHLKTEPIATSAPRLADVASASLGRDGEPRPDWTALRSLLDHLALHPEDVEAAITPMPPRSEHRSIDALIAGIAEKLADDATLARPGWTHTAPKLQKAWAASPGTPSMRRRQEALTPIQLLERGLIVDEGSLWRRRSTPLDA